MKDNLSRISRLKVWVLAAILTGVTVWMAFLSPLIKAEGQPGPLVHLKRASFDPLLQVPDFPAYPALQAYPEDGSGVYLVQFDGPIQAGWKDDLSPIPFK